MSILMRWGFFFFFFSKGKMKVKEARRKEADNTNRCGSGNELTRELYFHARVPCIMVKSNQSVQQVHHLRPSFLCIEYKVPCSSYSEVHNKRLFITLLNKSPGLILAVQLFVSHRINLCLFPPPSPFPVLLNRSITPPSMRSTYLTSVSVK